MSTYSIYTFLLLLALSFVSPLSAKAIHLLYMGDTLEEGIKKSAKVDLHYIEKSFGYIAKACDIPLRSKKLLKKDLKQENIEAWIRHSPIAKDDIVVLYYSGHGGRSRRSQTIWPFGCMYGKEKVEFTHIIEKLLAKKAALCLVLLDCCNDFKTKSKGIMLREVFKLDFEKFDKQKVSQGCKKLFFKKYGLIVSSGAVPGKLSEVLGPDEGSYFTCHFLERFFQESHTENPQWEKIFKLTKEKVSEETKQDPFIDQQLIQYKLFLRSSPKNHKTYKRYLYNNCLYSKDALAEKEVRCFCGEQLLG